MATISVLARIIQGIPRNVDLSANTLAVQAIQINGTLLSSSTVGADGSRLVGDHNDYSNFTPTAATVKGALAGIDTAIGAIGTSNANQTLSNLTSPTAINQHLLPATDNARDLGSSTGPLNWRNLYIKGIFSGSTQFIDLVNKFINDSSGANAIDFNNRLLIDSSAKNSVKWQARQLMFTDGSTAMLDWSGAGVLDAKTNRIINGGNPTAAQDLATKFYVDNLAQGLNWKNTVRSATTGALPANTNVSGVLTATSNGALPAQDGVTLVVNDRLLVKNEATAANNGIYVVTQVGDGSNPFILTRSSDANTAIALQWATVEISPDASTQTGWIFRESDDITTINTDPVAFVIISHGLDWVFTNGLSTTGNVVNVVAGDTSLTSSPASLIVNLASGGALVTSSGLKVNLETTNPGLAISSNKLDVKYNAAGAIIATSGGISWNPDGSSLEISSNAARIKTTAYDQLTITGGGGSAAAVAQAPVVAWSEVAGQSFSANTTYAVRYGLTSNSETAGRVYAADTTTSSFDLFWVIGFIQTTGAVSAGQSVSVISSASLTLKSADTNFAGSDTGKPIFLQAGGINASTTAPSTSGLAVAKLGIVQSTTSFRVQIGSPTVA